MLLKEIAYWTYYFLSKNKSYGKSADTRIDSALIVYIAEQHIGLNILQHLPIKSRNDLLSWVWSVIIIMPIVTYMYRCYFRKSRISHLVDEYQEKSPKRLFWGKVYFVFYCSSTWIIFFYAVIIDNNIGYSVDLF
mgnify:CR=1 FL=1